ncbi:DNA cytosine methyltransferase [Clostridium septicum]|uniref:DNA cytosine methyltransferase n=1 Tax=Clostridium septicum TaxID=1504 RepID=UPI00272E1D39|nr:DNA cytosine methyltransferase [Clostridium septicum]WLF68758.1 DNA cytosine methyltransferase [Clostridium septicum]
MNVIDIFSGGGGLTEGFVNEGYKIVAHVEKDKWACETLKTRIIFHFLKAKGQLEVYNEYVKKSNSYRKIEENRKFIYEKYPELKEKLEYEVLNYTFGNPEEDSKATDIKEIINSIERSMEYNCINEIDLIIGGPPCQAYSLVGRGVMKEKVEGDKRNYLFRYYKEIVRYFSPKMFVFENVPGIITAKNGQILKTIIEEFNGIGYTLLSGESDEIKDNIINCSDLNIPQSRKRVVLFGFKSELNFKYPNLKSFKYNFEDISTKAAIGDLPKRKAGEGKYGEILEYPKSNNISMYQQYMREDSFGVTLHQTREHNERDLKNYYDVILARSKGKKLVYTDFPKERRTHKNHKSFIDRYNVHWWKAIPHTILAHLAKDGHYNIHPDIEQCRSLTVREAARIQTFQDNYFFEGPRTAIFTQIGNAVPPLLSRLIALKIKEIL